MTSRSARSMGRHHKPPITTQDLAEMKKFKLPGSMSFSDINFPVLIKPERGRAVWKAIEAEHTTRIQMLQDFNDRRNEEEKKDTVFIDTEADYIRDKVFGILLPVLEKTLDSARTWNAFEDPMCLFNGVDHLAQLLWNNNPLYPTRQKANLYIFNMPWVQEYLKSNPRPHLPRSWLWTKDYAATIIQKSYRRYLTQLKPEVQEMREFWNKLQIEDKLSKNVSSNPILMKVFAQQGVRFNSFGDTDEKDKEMLDKIKKLV